MKKSILALSITAAITLNSAHADTTNIVVAPINPMQVQETPDIIIFETYAKLNQNRLDSDSEYAFAMQNIEADKQLCVENKDRHCLIDVMGLEIAAREQRVKQLRASSQDAFTIEKYFSQTNSSTLTDLKEFISNGEKKFESLQAKKEQLEALYKAAQGQKLSLKDQSELMKYEIDVETDEALLYEELKSAVYRAHKFNKTRSAASYFEGAAYQLGTLAYKQESYVKRLHSNVQSKLANTAPLAEFKALPIGETGNDLVLAEIIDNKNDNPVPTLKWDRTPTPLNSSSGNAKELFDELKTIIKKEG